MSDDPQTPVVVQPASAATDDPIPAAIAQIQTRIDTGRAARIALTDRVVVLEGKAPVPGPRGATGPAGAASTVPGPAGPAGKDGQSIVGPAGVKGDRGDVGPAGPAGAASTVPGPAGPAGKDGAASTVPGPVGPQGPAGAASTVPGPQGTAGILGIQRTTVTTDANGNAVWTFPTAYAAGVLPVCSADVQDASTDMVAAKITALSNTAVTIKATKPALVLTVLNIQAAASVKVHLTAMPPT